MPWSRGMIEGSGRRADGQRPLLPAEAAEQMMHSRLTREAGGWGRSDVCEVPWGPEGGARVRWAAARVSKGGQRRAASPWGFDGGWKYNASKRRRLPRPTPWILFSHSASALAPRGASDSHWSPLCSLLGPRHSASGWRPPTAPSRTSTLVITSAARALPKTSIQCRRPQRPGMQRRLRQQLHGCRPRRMSRCASKQNQLRPQLRLPSALRPPARRMLGPPGLVANVARREQMPAAGLDLTRATKSARSRTLAPEGARRGNAGLFSRSFCSHRRSRRHRSSRRRRPPRRQPQRRRG